MVHRIAKMWCNHEACAKLMAGELVALYLDVIRAVKGVVCVRVMVVVDAAAYLDVEKEHKVEGNAIATAECLFKYNLFA